MKKLFYRILLVSVCILSLNSIVNAGIIDTLRHYQPGSGSTSFNYPTQIARFELPGPSMIKSFIITLGGASSSGGVRINIYGHEGGDAIPRLQQPLIPAVVLHKTISGEQRIQYTLNEPLYLSNNEFFIQVTDFSPNTTLVSDIVDQTGLCLAGSNGSDFYFQFFQNSGGTYYNGTKAYKIDVVIDREVLPNPSWFQDYTAQSGILSDAYSCRGFSVGDFNNDGYQDMIRRNLLYRNDHGHFTDITTAAGISGGPWASAFADMDNDGLLDFVFVLDTSIIIYKNNGNETFTPYVAAHTNVNTGFKSTQAFSVADIDNDGYPDLFLGRLWNTYPNALPNYLFKNNGNYTLTDVTTLLYPTQSVNNKRTRASQFVDYDDDGMMDLYVTNYYLEKDELWHNNGNLTFTNVIYQKLIDLNTDGTGANHGTGVAWADYDNDMDMDLLLPQFAHPAYVVQYLHQGTTLYRNEGPPAYNFTDLEGTPKPENDIQFEETHAGAGWADVNNDGLLDFYITNFYNCRYSDLYLQNADHRFELKTQYYLSSQEMNTGEDCLFFDFDNDGRIDMLTGAFSSYINLYKNNEPSGNNYIDISLHSTTQNAFALGARAIVYVNGKKYMREVCTGRGARMGDPYLLHFGLGNATQVDSVLVRWPGSQTVEKFTDVIVNNINVLTEGGIIAYQGNHADISPELLIAPLSSCSFTSNENISIRVRNYGSDTVHGFNASYAVNGIFIPAEIVMASLVPGGFLDYTFSNQADLSISGTYTITTAVFLTTDSISDNDTISSIIHNGHVLYLPEQLTICEGDTTVVNTEIGYPATYLWSDANQTTTPWINLSQTGTFHVTVTDTCGNVLTDSVNISVIPLPSLNLPNDTTITAPATLALDAGNTGTAYYWSNGEVTQTITVSTSGTYFVNVYNGNCMTSDTILVSVLGGIGENGLLSHVSVYPNPATDYFQVEVNETDFTDKVEATVFGANGEIVKQVNSSESIIRIDIQDMANGIYFVRVKGNRMLSFLKLVKL